MGKGNSWLKWALGLGVIGIALGVVSQLNFGDSLVYFYTPKEAVAKAQELQAKNVKVGGMVKPGTVQWDAQALQLDFVISDLKETEIFVSHKGVKPDMFKEGQGVVVEGQIDPAGQKIVAQKLLVKHSEEYQAPHGDQESMNKALLEQSLFKNEKE